MATITTDDTGIAKISGLPLGKYYVKEKATVEGFGLDDEAREIDLTSVSYTHLFSAADTKRSLA